MSGPADTLLVLGFANSGKTHFGAQLLDRLRVGDGRVRLGDFPTDLSALEEALRQLQGGVAAKHTPIETYAELPLSLRSRAAGEVSLVWPDYGGEQLRMILEKRRVPSKWASRLAASDRWMLFVRPSTLHTHETVPQRLEARFEKGAPQADPPATKWDDNARFVEMLQLLLYAAGKSVSSPLTWPRVAVMLSCWDELPQPELERAPAQLLAGYLPLLNEFLVSNWRAEAWSVWGLSSLGKSLSSDHPDADFVDKGPSTQGYAVRRDATKTRDLTEPLEWLIAGT